MINHIWTKLLETISGKFSSIEDNNGNKVLRVTDVAPAGFDETRDRIKVENVPYAMTFMQEQNVSILAGQTLDVIQFDEPKEFIIHDMVLVVPKTEENEVKLVYWINNKLVRHVTAPDTAQGSIRPSDARMERRGFFEVEEVGGDYYITLNPRWRDFKWDVSQFRLRVENDHLEKDINIYYEILITEYDE